jgi:hypothetical protein
MLPDLSDDEIDQICDGLTQNAARVRYLKVMGLVVRQKPNGRPLVNRTHYIEQTSKSKVTTADEPNWAVTT